MTGDGASGDGVSDVFEAARARLTGRAYRIVGSFADADDVVQEAWLRWDSADRDEIDNPDAWLNTVVSRLAIDRLRQRKREEERYTGPWLPTPLVERSKDPADLAELTDSMTSAFLIMLEELTPDERAAFLLADVFGDRYDSIAASMGRTPESCRQLASRARRKVRAAEQRRRDATAESNDVAGRFITALATGDEAEAMRCLAPDAVYLSDGGPEQRAARRPVREPARIVRLLMNLWRRFPESWTFEPALVGGFPGLVIEIGDEVSSVTGVEVVDGRIVRITSILNPDKLVTMNRLRTSLEEPMPYRGRMRIDVIDQPDAEVPARPAATLVLVRDGDGELEVLMIHRGAETAFGGMWAFPGGGIEDDDIPAGTEPDPLPAARRAAVRETQEEISLTVDPDSLVFWSHWLPPGRNALSPKRYSTWFFIAEAHDGHADHVIDVDGNEVHAHQWVPPAVALHMQERGEILIAPPTYVTLTQLARYGDVASALAAADPRYFATHMLMDGETRLCLWEGDAAYGLDDHTIDGPRHRLAMDEVNGWRYFNTVG